MITFACSACQKKLSVKEEFAGKKAKCPGCGQVVAVPAQVVAAPAVEEMATVPPSPGPAPSRQDERTNGLTHPPSNNPDATHGGNKPKAGHDSSLTDFLAPPQAGDELGRLGKYRILKILGHGGMGVVFKAEDPALKRSVALKAMLPTLAASASAGKRFMREAQAMAAVKHDHIATIYQVDEERGVPFLAMEFLAGEPLDERLKRPEKLPLAEVLRIGREIAEGLDAAHATGLIHRDIKPANIWLETPRNRVKILDFGLARAVSEDSGLTQQGAIMGTPAFMSPEQGRGEAVDARCDLFSLGVVLYRLCTGHQPFKGKDAISTIMEVVSHQPPPPIRLNTEVPQELSDLVMKLLEKDNGRRPASAGKVVQILEVLQRNQTGVVDATTVEHKPAPRPQAKAKRSRTPLLVALGLLALVPLVWWLATVVLRVETTNGSLAADRKAAEWVLSIGGTVCVNGQEREINAAADLPRKSFRLTQVLLNKNKQASDAGLAHFEGCKNLTVLGLRGTEVGNAGLAHFKGCKGLTQLALGGTKVSDAGLAYFMDCKDLTKLFLHNTKVSDAGLALFKDCKSLTVLDLSGTQVSDEGLAPFKDCKNLTELWLNRTQVSDAGLALFKDCKNLTELWLNRTQVSDAGLALFKDFKGLTVLALGHTKVGDAGLAHFKNCKGLMTLNLGETQVSDAGLAYFKGCMNLTVLILNNTKVSDTGMAHFKGCKNLTQLDLARTQVSDAGLAYFMDCNGLTVLALWKTKVGDAGLAYFKECKSLTKLNVAQTQVSDAGLAYFKECKSLTQLNLGVTQVSDAGLAYFKECKNLTQLDLARTQVSDAGMAYFKECKALTVLVLWNTKVGDAGLAYFNECKSLTHLNVAQTQVTDAGLAYVKECKSLTQLNLGNMQVSDAGLAYFKDCKNLTELFLHNTKVSDVGVAHFKDCKGLKVLVLTNTKVSDAGLAYFTNCKNLTELDLQGTKVSNAGLAPFKDCKNLANLRLQKTKVTRAKVEEFKKVLPKCKIEWDGGVIEPRASLAPDRKAAKWVLSSGGLVRVNEHDREFKASRPAARAVPADEDAISPAFRDGVADYRGCPPTGLTL